MRLGTYYRSLILNKMNIKANKANVLDVGCYDGYFLAQGEAKTKIGVDLNPVKKYKNIKYIKGDIYKLRFNNKKFDQIFAFEVLEHVKDDRLFIKSLIRLLTKNGEIILSTPDKKMTIWPSFLTSFAHKKWGHYRVLGYNTSEIKKILPKNIKVDFIYRKEFFYRTCYLVLRLMWYFSQSLTMPVLRLVAYLDSLNPFGREGHLFIFIKRK